MNKILFTTLFCFATVQLSAADPFLFGKEAQGEIVVNNRVLATVNNHPITVLDVMKKMDMLFLKQFPEYTSSPPARFQYYQVNWKSFLQELIDKQLILADAEESKLPVSAGDVRQEMETLFGPNVIGNLDKIGLSMDEAFKIVQGDLTIRRMMMIRVNSKAMRSITPQVIREAYDDFSQKNVKKEAWHYQVVTIKNSDPTLGAETAQAAFKLLSEDKVPLDDLLGKLKEKNLLFKSTVTLSDPLYQTEEEMNEAIRTALKPLDAEAYSQPIAQKSRTDKSMLFRIVFLKEKVAGGAVPYNEIEMQLKNELYEKMMAQESEAYLKKLRKHYAIPENFVKEMIPDTFQPFTLR